jgi:AcrR family transcriptional regulator
VELARAGGPDAVVLRDVQRAAGVSNSAAYRHYADRQALLTAVQIYGMTLLGEAMIEALAAIPPRGPRNKRALARFRATGQAYIDFALAHRAHFQLMFASGRLDRDDAALQGASGRSFEALQQSLLAVMHARGLPLDTLPRRLLLAWSAVHGYASLLIEGQCLLPFGLTPTDPVQASTEAAGLLRLLEVSLAGSPATAPGAAGGENPPRAEI